MTAIGSAKERELQPLLKEERVEKWKVRRSTDAIIEDVREFLKHIHRGGTNPLRKSVEIEPVWQVEVERVMLWKQSICSLGQSVKRREIPVLLEFLDVNLAEWEKLCKGQDLIYISRKEPVQYDFEYRKDGTIWMYYTYRHEKSTHDLAINLDTGESRQIIRFSKEAGKRIIGFLPLFKEIRGIVQFSEFFQIKETGDRLVFVAKHVPCNVTLFEKKYELDFKKFASPLQRCLLSVRMIHMSEEQRAKIQEAIEGIRVLLPYLRAFEKERIVEANEKIGKQIQNCLRILDEEKKKIEQAIGIARDLKEYLFAFPKGKSPSAKEKTKINITMGIIRGLMSHLPIFQTEIGLPKREIEKQLQICAHVLEEEKTVLDISEISHQFEAASRCLQGPGALESEEIEWQVQIVQQILHTLRTLEERGIVHCGIFPSEILCDGMDVYISNLGCVHHSSFLPKELLKIPQKWEVFIPPECANTTLDCLWHPFAIPVFQSGRCFEYCFNYNPRLYLIIEGMTHPDPAKRWTVAQALKALDEDLKEPAI